MDPIKNPNQLFEEHEDLARIRARQIAKQMPALVKNQFEELHQELLIALYKCCKDFDPLRSVPFPQFAMKRLSWAAWRFLFPDHATRYPHVSLDEPIPGADGEVRTLQHRIDNALGEQEVSEGIADEAKQEMIGQLKQLLDKPKLLTKSERTLIELRFYQDKDYSDIAEAMGLTPRTCLVYMTNAYRKLAKKMGANRSSQVASVPGGGNHTETDSGQSG